MRVLTVVDITTEMVIKGDFVIRVQDVEFAIAKMRHKVNGYGGRGNHRGGRGARGRRGGRR